MMIKQKKSHSHLHFERLVQNGLLKCKRSQTEVIVTVLLILVGIAGVIFVGTFATNFIKQNTALAQKAELFIDSSSMVPFYYSNTSNVYLSIGRGIDDADVSGVVIIITSKGDSKSFKYALAPQINERKLYAPGPFASRPDYVAIAAVVRAGEKEKTLVASEKVAIIDANQFFYSLETDGFFTGKLDLPPEPANITIPSV